jgi:hypothetical protein
MPDWPSYKSSDSSIDEDEGGPIHISVGDEVRYFFLGIFGDKSLLHARLRLNHTKNDRLEQILIRECLQALFWGLSCDGYTGRGWGQGE